MTIWNWLMMNHQDSIELCSLPWSRPQASFWILHRRSGRRFLAPHSRSPGCPQHWIWPTWAVCHHLGTWVSSRYVRSAYAVMTLFPTVKCVVSDWSSWSSCSTTSGLGKQERTRKVIQEPHLMGMPCPELTDTRWCQPGELFIWR